MSGAFEFGLLGVAVEVDVDVLQCFEKLSPKTLVLDNRQSHTCCFSPNKLIRLQLQLQLTPVILSSDASTEVEPRLAEFSLQHVNQKVSLLLLSFVCLKSSRKSSRDKLNQNSPLFTITKRCWPTINRKWASDQDKDGPIFNGGFNGN